MKSWNEVWAFMKCVAMLHVESENFDSYKKKIFTATFKSLKTKNLSNINADKVSSILCYVNVYCL